MHTACMSPTSEVPSLILAPGRLSCCVSRIIINYSRRVLEGMACLTIINYSFLSYRFHHNDPPTRHIISYVAQRELLKWPRTISMTWSNFMNFGEKTRQRRLSNIVVIPTWRVNFWNRKYISVIQWSRAATTLYVGDDGVLGAGCSSSLDWKRRECTSQT
jgi:hypothetical protein